jgi:hypothetical protein
VGEGVIYKMRMLMKSNGDCVQRTIKAWWLFMKLIILLWIWKIFSVSSKACGKHDVNLPNRFWYIYIQMRLNDIRLK